MGSRNILLPFIAGIILGYLGFFSSQSVGGPVIQREQVNDHNSKNGLPISALDLKKSDKGSGPDPISKIFSEYKDRRITKWSHYLPLYHQHFQKFRGKEVHILEIGLFKGGSVHIWKKYFGSKAKIYGVDINPSVKEFKEDQVEIFVGSQSNRTFLRELRKKIPRLDILIDDGGHRMIHQKVTFEELFDHVKNDGGIYWCEDLHTSYWKEYGGGYKRNGSFIELSKTWIDTVNAHYSRGAEKPNDFTEHVKGISYYDSVVVIEKQEKRDVRSITKN